MPGWKDDLKREWRQRATREGVRKVMSVRYPADTLDAEATKYAQAAMDFMGDDLV